MTFSVLITNYRNWPLTCHTVGEVLRWSGDQIEKVVVVDDCSDAPQASPFSAKVEIVRNAVNLGYVRSINVGMRFISSDIAIILDADAYPTMELCSPLMRRFSTDDTLAQIGFHETGDDGRTRLSGEPEPTALEFALGQRMAEVLGRYVLGHPSSRRTVVHSCCMAVRTIAFNKVKGFDESFDFLDADIDFSLRLQLAGYSVALAPDICAHHKGGGSPQTTAKRVARHHKNRWLLLQKHRKIRSPRLLATVLASRHILEIAVLCALRLGARMPADRAQEIISGRYRLLSNAFNHYEKL